MGVLDRLLNLGVGAGVGYLGEQQRLGDREREEERRNLEILAKLLPSYGPEGTQLVPDVLSGALSPKKVSSILPNLQRISDLRGQLKQTQSDIRDLEKKTAAFDREMEKLGFQESARTERERIQQTGQTERAELNIEEKEGRGLSDSQVRLLTNDLERAERKYYDLKEAVLQAEEAFGEVNPRGVGSSYSFISTDAEEKKQRIRQAAVKAAKERLKSGLAQINAIRKQLGVAPFEAIELLGEAESSSSGISVTDQQKINAVKQMLKR